MHAKPLDTEIIKAANTLKDLRNEAIIKEFDELTTKKHLDSTYVVNKLSGKYYLSETTIWRIVTKTGYYSMATTSAKTA